MFINHLIAGTVKIKKTIPKQRSKRFEILNNFCWKIGLASSSECAICGLTLLNPQSKILHVGTLCKNKKFKNEIRRNKS